MAWNRRFKRGVKAQLKNIELLAEFEGQGVALVILDDETKAAIKKAIQETNGDSLQITTPIPGKKLQTRGGA